MPRLVPIAKPNSRKKLTSSTPRFSNSCKKPRSAANLRSARPRLKFRCSRQKQRPLRPWPRKRDRPVLSSYLSEGRSKASLRKQNTNKENRNVTKHDPRSKEPLELEHCYGHSQRRPGFVLDRLPS